MYIGSKPDSFLGVTVRKIDEICEADKQKRKAEGTFNAMTEPDRFYANAAAKVIADYAEGVLDGSVEHREEFITNITELVDHLMGWYY